MFESIRRAREVKRAESAPPASPEIEKKEEGVDLGRRHFLRGAVAATALSAVPAFLQQELAHAATLEGSAGVRQREVLLDDAIATMRHAVQTPDVRDALNGAGSKLVTRALRPIKSPIDASLIRETKYDASRERTKHCVQVVCKRDASGKKDVSFKSEGRGGPPYASSGFSNGVFWGHPNQILITQHTYENATDLPLQKTPRDLRFVRVSKEAQALPEQVIQDDTSLSNADIHGAFVTVDGIDPDQGSDFKTYACVAEHLTRGFADRVFATLEPYDIERYSHSFMIVLPQNEAVVPVGKKITPAAGMSGAPVWMYRNGARVFAGILHSVHAVPDSITGAPISIGFFHGIEEVREQFAAQTRSGA